MNVEKGRDGQEVIRIWALASRVVTGVEIKLYSIIFLLMHIL